MIAIINYEMGNLRSVQKALEKVGYQATITSDPAEVAAADRIVLPGVGAFSDAIAAIKQRQLVEPIKTSIAAGKPFLGVCLGMQLLFDTSYEGGEQEGLGIVPGVVRKFEIPAEFKVPHMGWNQVSQQVKSPLFEGIENDAYFYFVHSYYVEPSDPAVTAGATDYGLSFCASLTQDNLFATQFHPEKSQADGLRLLKNFAAYQAV